MRDTDLRTRIVIENAEQSAGQVRRVRQEVADIGPAASSSAGGVSQMAQGLLGVASMVGALNTVKQAVEGIGDAAKNAAEKLAGLQKPGATLSQQYGAGATGEAARHTHPVPSP